MTKPSVQQTPANDQKPKAKDSSLGESFSLQSVTAIPQDFLEALEQTSSKKDEPSADKDK